jgi:methionyl-tRNA formyltransferase
MKCAVVGGVHSTEVLLTALVCHQVGEVGVWGYEPPHTASVAGWCDLRRLAADHALPFQGFRRVTECDASLRAFAPDILFVVGLSQVVPPSMLTIAVKANVGFHPTALPRGRGRAALAWLILNGEDGAATFFQLCEGVDDGPIFVQEPFVVAEGDDAGDIEARMLRAERVALDRWLPRLAEGDLSAKEQDHCAATWLGCRRPEDGLLNWRSGRDDLLRLVRASTTPYPGAFTYCQSHKIFILRAMASDRHERGVPGRILKVYSDGGFEVQTAEAIMHVTQWRCETDWIPRVGALLGYHEQAEIFDLRVRVAELERTVSDLAVRIAQER